MRITLTKAEAKFLMTYAKMAFVHAASVAGVYVTKERVSIPAVCRYVCPYTCVCVCVYIYIYMAGVYVTKERVSIPAVCRYVCPAIYITFLYMRVGGWVGVCIRD